MKARENWGAVEEKGREMNGVVCGCSHCEMKNPEKGRKKTAK